MNDGGNTCTTLLVAVGLPDPPCAANQIYSSLPSKSGVRADQNFALCHSPSSILLPCHFDPFVCGLSLSFWCWCSFRGVGSGAHREYWKPCPFPYLQEAPFFRLRFSCGTEGIFPCIKLACFAFYGFFRGLVPEDSALVAPDSCPKVHVVHVVHAGGRLV